MFAPENLHRYDVPGEPYLRDMTVQPGEGFRFSQVCLNDATDTNPPLHYLLLHGISSFFPGRFSYWFGGGINLVFLLLSVILLARLMLLLDCPEPAALLAALLFGLLPGVMEIVQFIRMYTLCMFFCIWLTYGQVKCLKSDGYNWRLALGVLLPTVGGALTHYYFLLFAAFQCLGVGICYLVKKRWRDAGLYALTFAAAAAVTLAVFPQMIQQMFGGWLTDASLSNLTQTDDFAARLKGYFFVINTRLFGGWLPELALGCGLWLFLAVRPADLAPLALGGRWRKGRAWAVCLAIPCGLYFLLVTKISFFSNTRYMCLIYPFLVGMAVMALAGLLRPGEGKPFCGLTALVCAAVLLSSMSLSPARSLEYSGADASNIRAMEAYADLDVVCVYDTPWSAQTTYNLNKGMNGLTFVHRDEISRLPGVLHGEGAFVAEIPNDREQEPALEALRALYPGLGDGELICQDYFFDVYLFR